MSWLVNPKIQLPHVVTRHFFTRHLCHTPSLSHHNFVTQQLCHAHLSHHLCHTFGLTQSFTHTIFVTCHTPSSTHIFVWQEWHLVTPNLLSRGMRGTWRHRPSFCVASVALLELWRTQLLHTTLSHTPSFTHHFVTHRLSHTTVSHNIFHTHHLPHTSLSHAIFHTQLSHTTSFTHTIFHTHLCHTPSFTHNFIFHTPLCHTQLGHTPSLSHTIFHTPSLSHTIFHTQLCHTQSFTHHLCTLVTSLYIQVFKFK